MTKWEPFYRRNSLPIVMLKVIWKTQMQYGTDTFNTYYYIGRLPYKYHEQLCERFEKGFVDLRQETFKEKHLEFVACCVRPYEQIYTGSFIEHAREFVEANCKAFEEQDWLESKGENIK